MFKAWLNEQRRALKLLMGKNVYLHTADRTVLEKTIIPYFAERKDCDRVLFMGCEWYTEYYERLFAGKDYWTIEINPKLQKYGARNHVIGSIQNLESYFQPNRFDLMVCNGVFGFGINTAPDAEQALEQCFRVLRDGGILVFGWNDTPDVCPFSPEDCATWKRFKPYLFPPLGTPKYPVPNAHKNHTFCFLVKDSAD